MVENHIAYDAMAAPLDGDSVRWCFGHIDAATCVGMLRKVAAGAAQVGSVTSETNPAVDSL